jgi:hypothetical protein
MLSKRVTRSGKVSALSSDTARMIYSWLIPYTDVEGRMEADPRLLKADIAPLLDHITPEVINRVLLELHKICLIVLYSSDDGSKQYLQITKFEDNQKNLRKDREAASRIPPPSADKVRQDSGETPAELPPNIREVKLREAKETPAEVRQESSPVDNSNGNAQKEAFFKNYKIVMDEFTENIQDTRYLRQITLFVESHISNRHPEAIQHCLNSLIKQLKSGVKVDKPKAYLEAALKIEDGKYNARDHEGRAAEFKKPGEFTSVAELMAAKPDESYYRRSDNG